MSKSTQGPVVLIIRDGWGINPGGRDQAQAHGDATLLARTPFHDHLYATRPWARISGSGEDVGLPPGQMGNSEVGHLNLGAGRIVYQDLTRINKSIRDGELAGNPVLVEAMALAAKPGVRLHLMGLIMSWPCVRRRARRGVGTSGFMLLPMGVTPRRLVGRGICGSWRRSWCLLGR